MARINVRREADGTFTVSGYRMEGKVMAKRTKERKVTREGVHDAAARVLTAIVRPGPSQVGTEGSAGERRVA